jgi:glycine/D-amino acid oxidase-like deaminating enzyme
MSPQDPKNIVIIGGGIIGSTSAYFLSHHPSFQPNRDRITLLESTGIASGASGKAGGLLALWAYPWCIVPLSFRLHKELAEKHDGEKRWGYRKVGVGWIECVGRPVPREGARVDGKENKLAANGDGGEFEDGDAVEEGKEGLSLQKRSKKTIKLLNEVGLPEDLDWIDAVCIRSYEEIGDSQAAAQVHPYLFTTSMVTLAEEKGLKVVFGSATSINQGNDGRVESVEYMAKEDRRIHTVSATHVVLSAGPWTQKVWTKAPIQAMRAHSVTIRPTRPVSAYAFFTEIQLPKDFKDGEASEKHPQYVTPEIYSRPNNEVYACGEGDHLVPIPATTDLVQVDPQKCQNIVDYVGSISNELRDGDVTARQACYLPQVSVGNGGPIIGETRVKGLIIAAGHTCWGIQNGPGTGKLVSEIVFEGGPKSANIQSLNPKRFGL